jgi:hypothetical protein
MTRADLTEEVCQAWLPWTEQSPIVASPRGGALVMWPTGTPHLRTTGDDGHSYPAQSLRRVVSPCARAVVGSRSRMAINMDRTCGIARFSLSATGR